MVPYSCGILHIPAPAAGEEESIASQGARPADEAATHKAQDKEGDAKDKAAAAPGGQDVAPDNLAPAKEGEPEISWRGTRTGEDALAGLAHQGQ